MAQALLSSSSTTLGSRAGRRAAAKQSVTMSLHASKPLTYKAKASQLAQTTFLTGSSTVRLPARTAQQQTFALRVATPIQAGLVDRFFRVIRSYVNFYGDAVVSSGEDPTKLLDTAVTDMQNDLIKMRQASAQIFATQKVMQRNYEAQQASADDWQRRAELALRAGQEDLAREALRRKKAFQDVAERQRAQLEPHSKAAETLRANIRLLEGKLTEAKSKKETLKARATSAQASKMLNEQLSDMVTGLRSTSTSSLAAFNKMEEKVLAMEAEAESLAMLAPAADQMESQFLLLEGKSDGVEDELLKLKTEMLVDKRPLVSEGIGARSGYFEIRVN